MDAVDICSLLSKGARSRLRGVGALPAKKKGVHSFSGAAGLVLVVGVKLLYMVFWACAAVGASCMVGLSLNLYVFTGV